jgi:hypothetical protein
VLFFISGSLASGKSTLLRELATHVSRTILLDSDIPKPATTTAARQRQLQERLAGAIRDEPKLDIVHAGQSPLGELLACPIATHFEGMAACLLDCDDAVRIRRLKSRGGQTTSSQIHVLRWAAWMRRHAVDPKFQQGVLLEEGAGELNWERWTGWSRTDPRWQVAVIDSSDAEPSQIAQVLTSWMEGARQLLLQGRLPLARGWELRPPRAAVAVPFSGSRLGRRRR